MPLTTHLCVGVLKNIVVWMLHDLKSNVSHEGHKEVTRYKLTYIYVQYRIECSIHCHNNTITNTFTSSFFMSKTPQLKL